MSENMQGEHFFPTPDPGSGIKAALMRAPLELLLLDQPRNSRKIRKDLIGSAHLRNPEFLLDRDYYLECFDRMKAMASGSDLFLRAGLSPELAPTGLFGKAVIHCETLWDALTTSKDLLSFLMPGDTVSYRLTKGRFQIRYVSPFKGRPGTTSHMQHYIALFLYLLRLASWQKDANLAVCFPGAHDSYRALIPEAAKLQSGPIGLIEFDDSLLRSPMKNADPLFSSITLGVIDKINAQDLNVDDPAKIVAELQFQSVTAGSSQFRLADAAFLLGLPVRTLQAQLNASNTSFAQIRGTVLHKIARQDLLAGQSLSETSEKLGFTHRQSFSEAFTKWEGENPSVFASRRHSAPRHFTM